MTTSYKYLVTDNANSTLAVGITAASGSMQVVSGGGALFPVLTPEYAFICTLVKNGSPSIREIVLVTGHTVGSDNFTGLVRNFDGKGALAWSAGDTVSLRFTAKGWNNLVQAPGAQAQQFNYAIDTGSANNYSVAVSPSLNGHVVGMPIRWRAGHTNTSSVCSFNDSVGGAQLITSQQHGIPIGAIVAGGIYECAWDGTYFVLLNVQSIFFSNISDAILNSQVPVGAVLQWQTYLAISATQLYNQILSAQIQANLALSGVPSAATAAVGTATGQLATCAFVNPGSSFGGVSNYRKEPDGSITQWGLCNPNGGAISVTFPVAFPTACRSLTIGQVSGGPTQGYLTATASQTGFTIANTGGQSYWKAKGN